MLSFEIIERVLYLLDVEPECTSLPKVAFSHLNSLQSINNFQAIIQMQYQISILKILVSLILISSTVSFVSFKNAPTANIGNYAPICIAINYNTSSASNKYVQYYFKSKIDELTSLQLTNIANSFLDVQKATATIYYQNMSITFTLIDKSQSIKRRFVSAVINMQDGLVTSIVGDNFCDDNCVCSNSECFEAYGTGYGTSDGIFYISWAGHDLSGTMLKSSTMRLSRYSLYSVSSVSGQLGKFVDGLKAK